MQIAGSDYSFNMSDREYRDGDTFLLNGLSMIPDRISRLTIDKYSEKRVMPAGSPRPGPWDNGYTPYLVETMRNMSPQSPVQREIILKAAQGGWTALAENVMCYYMDEVPADILFMSSGDDLLERWATRRLEPAIDTFGIREKLVIAHESDRKSKKIGDKAFSKDYYGGRLDMVTARSASNQRGTDKRILIRDEIDGVPAKLTTGEGYWLDVSWARTNSWEDKRKVLDFGTPTTYDQSETWKAYLMGDQRKFFVPCPRCGTFQVLEFGNENSQHGVKPVYEAGKLKDAVYMCEHCHDAIFNHERASMMRNGEWKPTAKSSEDFWVSRHWNSCYSPVLRLRSLWSHYERAKEKPDGMRSFRNLYDGLPYKEEGTRLGSTRLISLRSDYVSKTVPDGVLFTTCGADVQRGRKNDPSNPPRIEMEVCGHGKDYKTWSIDYLRIEGDVNNAYSGAWEELYQKIVNGELAYKNRDGVKFNPVRFFIDSGWQTHVVYDFVARLKNVFAVKDEGREFTPEAGTINKRKKNSDFRYKISKHVTDTKLYIIATNEYKRILRAALSVKRAEVGSTQPKMFCSFPSDYDKKYFDMLNADEMLDDGSFDKGGRPNEAAACRVYNMCAAESYLSDYVEEMRDKARKKNRFSEKEVLAIQKVHVLQKIENDLAIKSSAA